METLIKFIESIANTPLKSLLFVIGFIALSVGYGLKIKAVIDVENINKTYAKTIGIVSLVLSFILYVNENPETIITQPINTEAPFLIYYVVSVLIIAVYLGIVSKLTEGEVQLRTIKASFLLIAILISLVVVWRAIEDYFFVTGANILMPIGLGKSNSYLPYVVLLTSGIGVIAWIVFLNTKNRKIVPIEYRYFGFFLSCVCI